MNHRKILLVGLGPAGLAFLLASTEREPAIGSQFMAIDEGESLFGRLAKHRKPVDRGELTRGFGGAGLFSDGKFCLSLSVGGKLDTVLQEEERRELENRVDAMFQRFDGVSRITESNASAPVAIDLMHRGLSFTPYAVRHYGTDQLVELNRRLQTELLERELRFSFSTKLVDLEPVQGAWRAAMKRDSESWENTFEKVVLAVGKRGSRWLHELGGRLGLSFEPQPVRFGVRVEAPRDAVMTLLQIGLDPKVFRVAGGLKTKLHCFCDGGDCWRSTMTVLGCLVDRAWKVRRRRGRALVY